MTVAVDSKEIRAADGSPHPALEELVEKILESIGVIESGVRYIAQGVHDARRMRKAGDLDGALRSLAALDPAGATRGEVRWAYAEWLGLARRRFHGRNALLYSQGTGRAALLLRRCDGSLEVVVALGMRWHMGKVLSRRSLRGLRPLDGGKPC